MSRPVTLGPWGQRGDHTWNFDAHGPVKKLMIEHGNGVTDTIVFNDVDPTSQWNAPPTNQWNVPPTNQWNAPPTNQWNVPSYAGSKAVGLGPWGGPGGSPWSFNPEGRLVTIIVEHGECIDALTFIYNDIRGNNRPASQKFGGNNARKSATINLAYDEEITGISGTFGQFYSTIVVCTLSISTNKSTYGPYGIANGTAFSLPVTDGKIVGFFGRSGDYIDALGVYVMPN